MASDGWCTIESDPGVFSEMISRFGIKGVDCEELLGMDDADVAHVGKIYGFVFLFKWKPQLQRNRDGIPDADVFFAKQVISNACATQAILNILINAGDQIDLGEPIKQFASFAMGVDPMTRGELIGQNTDIRVVHNSFAKPVTFSFEENQKKKKAKEDDDLYHFVGYIEKGGIVWELDGLQQGAVFVDGADPNNWASAALRAIRARVEEISRADTTGTGQGISFSLMVLCEDRIPKLEAKAAEGTATPADAEELRELLQRRETRRMENIRRRHNYIPAIVELFKAVAEKGDMGRVIHEAMSRPAA